MRTIRLLMITALVAGACGENAAQMPRPACADGEDNDSDGMTDYPDDLGCDSAEDTTEDSSPKPQCSDGRDNDHDGLADYPADPGCLAPQQNDELDDCPTGPNCPQCANHRDDDGNGSTDYPNDPGCEAASDPTEFIDDPVACGAGLVIKKLPSSGMDAGMLDTASTSSVTSPCGGGAGAPAIAYLVSLAAPKVIVASTEGSAVNTVLDLRGAACANPGSEVACHDDIATTTTASRLVVSLPAGNYYLIVQGVDATATGAYALKVEKFAGEGTACTDVSECGPGLLCRMPLGASQTVCAKPACSDGLDDDGDTRADYPSDPGCAQPDDNDETDDCPTGPNCPACGNGVDDDGDTLTDYPADLSCASAAGDSEACTGEQDPIGKIVAATTADTLAGAHDDHDPTCGGNGGVDRLYTLTLPAMRSLTLDTENSTVDTLLSLLPATCQEPSLGCDDDGGVSSGASLLTRTNLPAATYVVAVDTYSASKPGAPIELHVTGVIAPGGSCEPAATLGGALACPATNPCVGSPGAMRCRATACNDGVDNDGDQKIDYPNEPGCASADDDDETDSCPGAGCPECADGIDNDGDLAADYPNDPTCIAASTASESCISTDGVRPLTQPVTQDTTTGASNDLAPACGSTTNTAPDHTYRLDLPALTRLQILDINSYNAVVALYDATCGGTALQCNDTPENLLLTNLAAGTYYYVTDGFSTAAGPYTLRVSGTIANGGSCESPLAVSGALTCGEGAICAGPMGARVCTPAACSDGIDNDNDGAIDYPLEPGCDSAADNDELDPAIAPACANGADDDGDMRTDYAADPSCWAASASTEALCPAETDRARALTSTFTTGTTTGAANDSATQSCQSSASGPDVAFALVLPVPVATLQIDASSSSFDTVLALKDAACATVIKCDDDGGEGSRSLLDLTNVAAGTYAVVLDGYSGGAGDYVLETHGTVASGTACDSPLFATGALRCATGTTCTGTPAICQ